MLGRLLSKTIKIVTLPIDAANSALDIATGGSGSKQSRTRDETFASPANLAERLRDRIAEAAESIDD